MAEPIGASGRFLNTDLSASLKSTEDSALEAESAFKAAMRHLAGGVSIVTVAAGRDRGGLTATSLVSLSAEPPSLLVSVRQDAASLPLMRRSGLFAVSILGHAHEHLAERFAGRTGVRGAERFSGAEWIGRPGFPPVLADALASFECEVEELIDRFTHTIVIGRVTGSRVPSSAGNGALVYWRASFDSVGGLKE